MDSLIAIITRLKAKGVPIDGVGLQFHMTYLVSNTAIDNALMKMAKLGSAGEDHRNWISSVNSGRSAEPANSQLCIVAHYVA